MKVAVIGAGNGGQAMAGYLSITGHDVSLCDINESIVHSLSVKGSIQLEGQLNGLGKINLITTDLQQTICGAEVIMIATTANAHRLLAKHLSNYLEDEQIVVLNPGRTGGALEFQQEVKRNNFSKRIYLAEAQTLVYACRIIEQGTVNIVGVKDKVLLAALPSSDTEHVLNKLDKLYNCFIPASNVLTTSLENIGAIFHPSVVLFNAAAIERGNIFYFYRDMTPSIASFIEQVDLERINLGKAYGIKLISAKEWVSFAYDNIAGETLCEKMKNNPAYYDIYAPKSIACRQLTEDIPTGIVPMIELGEIAGLEMPLFKSLLSISSSLLKTDFCKIGRNLASMGLQNCRVNDILKCVE
jgi:opine dehydrogenase